MATARAWIEPAPDLELRNEAMDAESEAKLQALVDALREVAAAAKAEEEQRREPEEGQAKIGEQQEQSNG